MSSSYREFDNFASMNNSSSSDGGLNGGGFQTLQNISNDVQHFNKNVSVLERQIRLLNTPQDDDSLRQGIIDLVGDTVQLAKMARTSIDRVKENSRSLSPPERMQFERLLSTFKGSVSKFQYIQQSTSDLEQEMLSRARAASTKRSPDSLPESERDRSFNQYEPADRNFSMQRQAQLQDTGALEQREREMRQLEHDILDVNEIFRDLGAMVHEQGEMVDNIESNVETTAIRVEAGNRQLESAVRAKKCSRKLTVVIVCVVTGVIVALIIVAVILVCAVGHVCNSNN